LRSKQVLLLLVLVLALRWATKKQTKRGAVVKPDSPGMGLIRHLTRLKLFSRSTLTCPADILSRSRERGISFEAERKFAKSAVQCFVALFRGCSNSLKAEIWKAESRN
jgi:hypothetical protein